MEIKYLGHASFLIKTKQAKIVTDPFDPKKLGMKFPRVEADIVTVSHQHFDHNQIDLVKDRDQEKKLIIDLPGEFEKKDVKITGFLSYHDDKQGEVRGENILYRIEADGLSVLHCGDLGFVPDDGFVDLLGVIDILMVPVGGVYTIDSKQAFQLIKKVEPSIVIPMHYGWENLAPVNDFLKVVGFEELKPIEKLTVSSDDLEEEMKICLLKKID